MAQQAIETVPVPLATRFRPDRVLKPAVLLLAVFIALVVGYSLRPVKAIMIGLQYRYRNVERESGP